jgi:hypothetical protein
LVIIFTYFYNILSKKNLGKEIMGGKIKWNRRQIRAAHAKVLKKRQSEKKLEWLNSGERPGAHTHQGCQIFLDTLYQNQGKTYQITTTLTNGHEVYQITVKYSK